MYAWYGLPTSTMRRYDFATRHFSTFLTFLCSSILRWDSCTLHKYLAKLSKFYFMLHGKSLSRRNSCSRCSMQLHCGPVTVLSWALSAMVLPCPCHLFNFVSYTFPISSSVPWSFSMNYLTLRPSGLMKYLHAHCRQTHRGERRVYVA